MNCGQLQYVARRLQQAAEGGDSSAAEQLLPAGTTADRHGWTALHYAAAAGITPLFKQLIDAGTAVDYKGEMDTTPLMCAVDFSQITAAELLLAKGAALGAVDSSGRTAFDLAVRTGCTAMTEMLFAKGAAFETSGSTPLHKAAAGWRPSTVEVVLNHGAAVNAQDRRGQTPLHRVFSNQQYNNRGPAEDCTQIARLLLAKGALVDTVDSVGCTPLHYAAEVGAVDAAAVLLEAGAAVSARDCEGSTPLHRASLAAVGSYQASRRQQGRVGVAELLLSRGLAVDAVDSKGNTALHIAAKHGDTDMARLLVSQGAEGDARDQKGDTPLSLAVQYGALSEDNDVFMVIVEAGQPWYFGTLVAVAEDAVQGKGDRNWVAFAGLAKALYSVDIKAYNQLLDDLQGCVYGDDMHTALVAVMGPCAVTWQA